MIGCEKNIVMWLHIAIWTGSVTEFSLIFKEVNNLTKIGLRLPMYFSQYVAHHLPEIVNICNSFRIHHAKCWVLGLETVKLLCGELNWSRCQWAFVYHLWFLLTILLKSTSGLPISNGTESLQPSHHASNQNKVSHKLILAVQHASSCLDLVIPKVFSSSEDSVTLYPVYCWAF